METYSTYAESSELSSPTSRGRDVDFENHHHQQPWEDQSWTSNKVKFMCSYGGKIHPRPHDNHLSYVGGDTKILAVDRFVKFPDLMAKLTALCCDRDVCFKYQLPGEDLDALISVTNDDDLQHMMHEYDRLNFNTPPTPARLRLFLFPISGQSPALTPVQSFGSTDHHQGRSDREQRFMDGLNIQSTTPPTSAHGNTEQIFEMPPQPSELMSRTTRDHQIGDPQDIETTVVENEADQIQKRIQELRIAEEQQPALYRKPSDDNLAASYLGEEYHVLRMTEKVAPATGYQIPPEQQPVYMIHHQTPTSMYMPRPVNTPVNQGQGYYVQRMPTEVYRDQPVYNVMPPTQPVAVAMATQQTTVSSQQQFRQQTYTEGYQMVQSSSGGVTDAQAMAYDNASGRQFYYANHGAVVAQPQHPLQATTQPYQVITAAAAATLNQENAVAVNIKELI